MPSPAVEFLVRHKDEVVPEVREHGPAKAWEHLQDQLAVAEAMTKQTFRMYAPVVAALSDEMDVSHSTTRYSRMREAGVAFFGELGAWAYDEWARLNELYFEDRNEAGPIIWGLTPHGAKLGHYNPERNEIVLHTSLVTPSDGAAWGIRHLGKKYASDVLLHEMMHQRIHQLSLSTRGYSSHNNEAWVNEVNRIAGLMGLEVEARVVRQRRVDGKVKWAPEEGCLSREELAGFPHSVVGEEFYL
jgi:hypothetical protein